MKVGDRVRIIAGVERLKECGISRTPLTGKLGVITKISLDNDLPYTVVVGDDGFWLLAEQDLELVEAADKEPDRAFFDHGDGQLEAISRPEPIRTFEPGAKDTNPKDLLGVKKVPTFFIPTQAVFEEGLVMLTGARKYGPFNWREKGVKFSVYYDAVRRHLDAFKERQDCDPESGLSHLAHARASLGIIMDSMACGNMVDDRPKLGVLDMNSLNETAKGITENIDRTKPVPGGY